MLGDKFLHLLDLERNGSGYMVGGDLWWGCSYSSHDSLSLHVGGGTIIVSVGFNAKEGKWRWEYSLKIAEGVYFRDYGAAETVADACAAARGYVPQVTVVEYLGEEHAWYCRRRDDGWEEWTAAIDGELAQARGPYQSCEKTDYFLSSREWAPAAATLALLDVHELRCKCATLQEAFIAAVDLPERLKRACGALIATIRSGSEG